MGRPRKPSPPEPPGSIVLAEQLYEQGDPRFHDELRRVQDAKAVAPFAERWVRDAERGAWARAQALAYLERPMTARGQHPLVKRFLRAAERARDDDTLAILLPAFDRLVRRSWRTRWSWSREGGSRQVEELHSPRDTIPATNARVSTNPMTGAREEHAIRLAPGARLFSYRTRYHLRRRAWRYFRTLGRTDPARYVRAITPALRRYEDADLAKGENVLDCWGLVHALFGESDLLLRTDKRFSLAQGRSLAELKPAPRFPAAWASLEGRLALLTLAVDARARLVRVFALSLLREAHRAALPTLPLPVVARLLASADAEVERFGAEVLDQLEVLPRLTVAEWLPLLETPGLTALETACAAFWRHVAPARVSLEEAATLAVSMPSPTARLGFSLLRRKEIRTPEDRAVIARLARARCAAVGDELCTFALGQVGAEPSYDREHVSAFFDSLLAPVREAAWRWLYSPQGVHAWRDAALWARLVESPFEDLKLRIVRALEGMAAKERARPRPPVAGDLAPLWSAVLLGVHRGGREKALAVRQVGLAIVEDPSRADTLLPVLAVAVRSIRSPERHAGLAAVVAALEARPDLAPLVGRHLPDLSLAPPGAPLAEGPA